MGFLNILSSFKNKHRNYQYAKMFNGQLPIFSQFGDDIYASDIVKNCVRCIATEISKLQPRHIRTNGEGLKLEMNSDINRLLKLSPNPVMTTSDFLAKLVWIREKYNNVFIYPTYKIINGTRTYTGLYPLNPIEVDFLQDEINTLYIKFTFANGENYTLPYSDVIHWRKDFTENQLMGGDANGIVDNKPLLKVLEINNTVLQGLDKAVKSSLSVRGILKVNTLLADEKQEEERQRFENKLKNSESGIIVGDLKEEFVPITSNPKFVDKDTLEFIEKKILNNFGLSLAILSGDFTDEQYQAFYEKTLEPMIISLGQTFSKTLFTDREIQVGNEIIFYSQKLLFTNTKNKIAVADILGNRGALTDNQLLDIFGYPPFQGGDVRHMSLNFINRDIADKYQMSKSNKGKGGELSD